MAKVENPLLVGIRPPRYRYAVVMILLCLPTCASSASRIPSPFADVPRGDWAYTALKQVEKVGIHAYPSICFPSDHGAQYDLDHRTLTRYEFAVITQRILVMLQTGKQQYPGRQIALQTTVNRLASEFSRELAQLNGH